MKKMLALVLCGFTFFNAFSLGKKDSAKQTLLVCAAASLSNAMKECVSDFQKEHPTIIVRQNYASSGALQQQIEQGASGDIFFSAGSLQMQRLVEKNLIEKATVQSFIQNELVLITSKNTSLKSFTDLSNPAIQLIAVGDFKSVPVGYYSKEVLDTLNLFKVVEKKLIYAKDAREVLSWVESANVDAGIVYKTDASNSKKVTVAAQDLNGMHSKIVYPVGIIKSSAKKEIAQTFVNFLASERGRAIFKKYGFLVSY
ncbi:MAG: molybdate ABC transporter substrate-binding protein [Treponemataceae bacterium]